MTTENSIKLLWKCANTLSGQTHAEKLLKSYYINTSRKIAKHKTLLPDEHYGISKMCPRCSSQWSDSDYQLRLKPQRINSNAKVNKLIAKFDESKTKQEKGLLTKSQRKRAKWLKKRIISNMQIKCEFCQHKTLIPLEKPKKRFKKSEPMPEVALDIPVPSVIPNKKKKKKPKDKNAGLKITTTTSVNKTPTVLNCPPKPVAIPQSDTTATTVTMKQQKIQNINTLTHSATIVSTKTTLTTKKTTAKCVNNNNNNNNTQHMDKNLKNKNTNKKKAKKNQQQKPQTPAPPLKVKSKTQKQNSLLQIAKLMKMEGTRTPQNSVQARLEALLREDNT